MAVADSADNELIIGILLFAFFGFMAAIVERYRLKKVAVRIMKRGRHSRLDPR